MWHAQKTGLSKQPLGFEPLADSATWSDLVHVCEWKSVTIYVILQESVQQIWWCPNGTFAHIPRHFSRSALQLRGIWGADILKPNLLERRLGSTEGFEI